MVCLLSIECATSYGKKPSNLTSFNESNSVFFSVTSDTRNAYHVALAVLPIQGLCVSWRSASLVLLVIT